MVAAEDPKRRLEAPGAEARLQGLRRRFAQASRRTESRRAAGRFASAARALTLLVLLLTAFALAAMWAADVLG